MMALMMTPMMMTLIMMIHKSYEYDPAFLNMLPYTIYIKNKPIHEEVGRNLSTPPFVRDQRSQMGAENENF